MPQMKMNRTWRVATTYGHTIMFEKGEIKFIPDDQRVIEACLAVGAEYVDAAEAPDLPDMADGKPAAPLTGAQRKEKVFTLFREMVGNQAAHRENFTAFGRPSAKFVASTLGIDISAKEVEEFWTEFQAPK